MARLTGYGMQALTWFLALALERWWQEGRKTLVMMTIGALSLSIVPGIVLEEIQLGALQQPVIADLIASYDVEVCRQIWDTLPKSAMVFDPQGWPAVAVTGRFTNYGLWRGYESVSHQTLVEHPSVSALLAQGYDYLYISSDWWYALTPQEREDLQQPCVRVVASHTGEAIKGKTPSFRRLVDLSACSP